MPTLLVLHRRQRGIAPACARPSRARAAFAATLVLSGSLGLVGCSTLPADLQPPSGQTLLLRGQLIGQWVYHCRLSNDGRELAWGSLRPQAQLRDSAGRIVGQLEAGPNLVFSDGSTWEATPRRSLPQEKSLPWSLWELRKAATPSGSAATALPARSAVLLNSEGGGPPSVGCQGGEDIMNERAVPFRAELRLYGG